MNVKKKSLPAVIDPNLIDEVAYRVVIFFIELPCVAILECTLRAAIGIDEGAIEVSDNVWRVSEDVKQELGDSLVIVRVKWSVFVSNRQSVGSPIPVRGLGTPGGCSSPP
jgi:hypothetical protein